MNDDHKPKSAAEWKRPIFIQSEEDWEKYNELFEDAAGPRDPNQPRLKFRQLLDYCRSNGKQLNEISDEEMRQFLTWSQDGHD